jgi:hypothetical protein
LHLQNFNFCFQCQDQRLIDFHKLVTGAFD